MTDESAPGPAPKDGSMFRGIIGFVALGAGIASLILLFFVEIPPRNENALMLALGIIIGWGGTVVASEYGSSTTGRKLAEQTVKSLEEKRP